MIKTFTVEFTPQWPVPCGLVINAQSKSEAFEIAKEAITHTEIQIDDVKEFDKKLGVVFYESGDY